jgi:CheY-like chemotaxis protein
MNTSRHDGSHSPPDKRTLQILVVGDCVDYRLGIALLLYGMGHKVRTASDGQVALRMAQENPPDIVLLDIALQGMDGYELARRLRAGANERHLLIVAVTGYAAPSDVVLSDEPVIDLHLAKPVEIEVFCELLARFHRAGL